MLVLLPKFVGGPVTAEKRLDMALAPPPIPLLLEAIGEEGMAKEEEEDRGDIGTSPERPPPPLLLPTPKGEPP